MTTSTVHESSFFPAAKKLYQIKFTALIFEKYPDFDSLFKKYNELTKDFSNIWIDFRLYLFSSRDFKRLAGAFANILELLSKCPIIITNEINGFMGKLNMFACFKFLLYLHDCRCEIAKPTYQLQTVLNAMKSICHTHIQIVSCCRAKDVHLQPDLMLDFKGVHFSIGKIIDGFESPPIPQSDLFELFCGEADNAHKSELLAHFAHQMGYLPPQEMTRLEYAEFAAKLSQALEENNEKLIKEIFHPNYYLPVRKLWVNKPEELEDASVEDMKSWLKLFRSFLLEYNQ